MFVVPEQEKLVFRTSPQDFVIPDPGKIEQIKALAAGMPVAEDMQFAVRTLLDGIGAMFEESYSEPIVVRDITFYSMCEHHMLPFYGKAHVAYIPSGRVVGLSKIPRVVEVFARRLQVQERMTKQIADFLNDKLHPRGVAVIAEGIHFCAVMRGVNQPEGVMQTQSVVAESDEVREELLALLKHK
jgi:GTP cyclohydrolase I